LASFVTQKYDLLGTKMVGFGALEEVRFRGPVIPGDRLIVIVQMVKARRGRMIEARFQGFVRDTLVFDGLLKGIPLPVDLHAPPTAPQSSASQSSAPQSPATQPAEK
jgi:3-hydroxyacyl-[acyl-carrier-protein] dehydratase